MGATSEITGLRGFLRSSGGLMGIGQQEQALPEKSALAIRRWRKARQIGYA